MQYPPVAPSHSFSCNSLLSTCRFLLPIFSLVLKLQTCQTSTTSSLGVTLRLLLFPRKERANARRSLVETVPLSQPSAPERWLGQARKRSESMGHFLIRPPTAKMRGNSPSDNRKFLAEKEEFVNTNSGSWKAVTGLTRSSLLLCENKSLRLANILGTWKTA